MRFGYYHTRDPIDNLRLEVKLRQVSGDTFGDEWSRCFQWNERLHGSLLNEPMRSAKASPSQCVLRAYAEAQLGTEMRCDHLGKSQPLCTHLPQLGGWEGHASSLIEKNCQIARDRLIREDRPDNLFVVAFLDDEEILLCKLTFYLGSGLLILLPDIPTTQTFVSAVGTQYEYSIENLSESTDVSVKVALPNFAVRSQRSLSVSKKSLFQLRLLKLCGWTTKTDRIRIDYQIWTRSTDSERKMIGRRSCLLTQRNSIILLGFYDAVTFTDVTQILSLHVQVYAVDSWKRYFLKGCGEIPIPLNSTPGVRHLCLEKPLQSFQSQLEEFFLGVEDTFDWREPSKNQTILRRTKSTNMTLCIHFSVFPSKQESILSRAYKASDWNVQSET
uniref:AlNc14C46G3730 protein n=1 Tax=Albugo laibachii Nc14 TaxID=890382 RepID=F0WAK6_9STRA|nr:AlNc14C46G3730 [Albugo laibachii Nc14]|eukprot:CCA18177.1 AlNc14C46G3730 [Albugo laibachii Nc14]